MTILKELDEIRKTIFPWIVLLFILFILFFSSDVSSKFFKKIQHDLLPKEMQLVVTNPLNALLVQIQISLFLALLFSLPYLLYKIIAYISPALHKHEKKAIVWAVVPSVILFALGSLFAYFVLIPSTFAIANSYVSAINALPFFEVNEFVSMVIAMTLASGILFMLPVFMKVLTSLEIVDAGFWYENWRYALLAVLIFSAIITPDGSGITMLILSMPLMVLYSFGFFLSKSFKHAKNK